MEYIEYVDAIIISDLKRPYEFWIEETRKEHQDRGGKRRICKGRFQCDELAIDWFRENYPNEFRHGVEMRCWTGDKNE